MSNQPSNSPDLSNPPDGQKPAIDFDITFSMASIEQHLEAAKRNSSKENVAPQAAQTAPLPPATPIPQPASAPEPQNFSALGSGLLAELAQEAAHKEHAQLSATQELQARAQRLNDALKQINDFLAALAQFANKMEPEISRSYSLDARTGYDGLKWKGAFLDARKQDLSATALLAHVTLSVTYSAPAPVVVRRPWGQLDALKRELNSLKLKAVDENELDGKRPQQEWLQVTLAPELPMQLRFLANYDKGHIDVLSRNLLAFGISSFRLQPEHISPSMLDDLGRVLLGRTNILPSALQPL